MLNKKRAAEAALYSWFVVKSGISERRLRRGQSCDRNSVWRATHVVQAGAVAEVDRLRFAAMLTTDSQFQAWVDTPTLFGCHGNQLSYSFLIQDLEWIDTQDTLLYVDR